MNINSEIDKNFKLVIKILNENSINYWICHGTLLGILRDGNLIPWDHDIDIAVWHDEISKDKVINLMEKDNFFLREGFGIEDDLVSFDKKGGRTVDFSFLKKKNKNSEEIAYVTYQVPKNFLMKLLDALANADKFSGKFKRIIKIFSPISNYFKRLKEILIKKNFYYKDVNLYSPSKLINQIETIEIDGLKVNIPHLSESYLKFIYGEDWRTPKKNYIWPRDYKTF